LPGRDRDRSGIGALDHDRLERALAGVDDRFHIDLLRRERELKEREGEQVPPEDVALFEKIGMDKIQPNLCEIALSGE
jgi:hypothetical protein